MPHICGAFLLDLKRLNNNFMAKSGAERQKTWRDKRREWHRTLYKPCEICSAFDVAFMEWHHLDPSTKKHSVSAMVSKRSDTREEILSEINKCACLCTNCHRKLHYYGSCGHLSLPDP